MGITSVYSGKPTVFLCNFCTAMYEAVIDILTAKKQMEHNDARTTLSVYTHLYSQHKKRIISKLEEYLHTVTD